LHKQTPQNHATSFPAGSLPHPSCIRTTLDFIRSYLKYSTLDPEL
jgi:hypothetical protein